MRIAPFHGVRYDSNVVSFISRVVAPPYDVIDARQARTLLKHDRHNAIRLILGKPGDKARSPRLYQMAARYFESWRNEGVLIRERAPAVYVCEQEFEANGKRLTQRGVICAMLLEDFSSGRVLPHESTMSGPKADRFELMKACRANPSQVFGIYPDSDGQCDALAVQIIDSPPLYEFRGEDEVAHKLYRVTDPGNIRRLAEALRQQRLIIADGHHRYETALRYRDELRSSDGPPGSAPEDFVPVYCVSVANRGLAILPTQRLVKAPEAFDTEKFLHLVAQHFAVERLEVPGGASLEAVFEPYSDAGDCIGCYLRQQLLCILRPRTGGRLEEMLPRGSSAWQGAPVVQLHYAILEPFFDIPTDASKGHPRLLFTQDIEAMFWEVESARHDAAFLLPPVKPATVVNIAMSNERMPPKSTFFCPKIPSGLIFYPFEGGPYLPVMPVT